MTTAFPTPETEDTLSTWQDIQVSLSHGPDNLPITRNPYNIELAIYSLLSELNALIGLTPKEDDLWIELKLRFKVV